MDGIETLIAIQIAYIAIMYFIIRATIRRGRKAVFYWVVVGLYLLTIAWLVTELLNMPVEGNGGYGFAIGMYSIVIPGILVFLSLLVSQISKAVTKKRLTVIL